MAIGMLLADQGRVQEAMAALEQQAAAADEDLSPRAALMLGGLLGTQGDVAGARALLEQAIASGHFDVAPRASLILGSLLASREDPEQVRFFEWAAASTRWEVAAQAALCLASYYAEQGDLARTQAAYQRAIETKDPDGAPWAALLLGRLHERHGDVDQAWAAYQQASTPTIRAVPSRPPSPLGSCWPAAAMTGTRRPPGSRPSSSRNLILLQRSSWRPCVSAGATVIVRQPSTSGWSSRVIGVLPRSRPFSSVCCVSGGGGVGTRRERAPSSSSRSTLDINRPHPWPSSIFGA
jgi:predicted negative regulator of RcsB-dependent stress response